MSAEFTNPQTMKYLQKTQIVPIILIFFWDIALGTAQPLTESEATPSASVLEKTKILITEVSFKNAEADFVKFTVSSAPQSPLNLKGLTFQDDSDFKTLNTDFLVFPGQVVTLLYKQSTSDVVPTINTTRTGLTATTEQIVIKNEKGKIMDALCWASSNPTESELTDLNDLYEEQAWISNTAGSCIPSDEVETDGLIQRKSLTDTNSLSDWEIINATDEDTPTTTNPPPTSTPPPSPTPSPSTTSNTESNSSTTNSDEEASNDLEINELPADEMEEEDSETESDPITIASLPKSTTAKSTTKKSSSTSTKKASTKKSTSKKIYSNGDESLDIHINEVMPNPSEPDQQNEWVEIINTGETAINLGNWQLDDDEGGSKPYVIRDTTTLEPNIPLLISITESKISLANKQDKVRILNFNDEIIDEITYQDAGEDMSYARISIAEETYTSPTSQEITFFKNFIPAAIAKENILSKTTITSDQDSMSKSEGKPIEIEDTWMWVKEGTPGNENPSMQKIHGTITQEPQFTVPYSFKVQTQNKELTIYFDEETIKAPLAQSLFTQNSQIDLLLKPNENNDLWLVKYEIQNSSESTKDFNIIPWLTIGLILSSGGTFLYLQKKLPWQKKKAGSTQKITNSV